MNLPNAAQLIRLAGKRQAVNNFLMARAESAEKRRKPLPFDLPQTWRGETKPECVWDFLFSKINSGLSSRSPTSRCQISPSSRWRAATRQPSLFAVLQGKFSWLAGSELGALVAGCDVPPAFVALRRGSLRFTLRSKRRLVPATGIEPVTSGL